MHTPRLRGGWVHTPQLRGGWVHTTQCNRCLGADDINQMRTEAGNKNCDYLPVGILNLTSVKGFNGGCFFVESEYVSMRTINNLI